MLNLPIDCIERCPYQKDGYCTKTDCKSENILFDSYNLCPYVSINIYQNQTNQKSLSVSNIPLTGIKVSL